MRIIGGYARGIRLDAGKNPETRPTTDRLKETLFNMIGCLKDDIVLDLFSGSGALGLEALSRGAKKVFFIENDKGTCDIINSNFQKVYKSMGGDCGEIKILCADWRRGLNQLNEHVDVIIADPPYGSDSEFAKALMMSDELLNHCHESSFLVLEHLTKSRLESNSWKQLKVKHCPPTSFSFFEVKNG